MSVYIIKNMSIKTRNILCRLLTALFLIFYYQLTSAYDFFAPRQAVLSRPLHLNWSIEINGLTNLTPAVGGGKAYIALDGGGIMALDTVDGSFSWRSDIGGAVSAAPIADTK